MIKKINEEQTQLRIIIKGDVKMSRENNFKKDLKVDLTERTDISEFVRPKMTKILSDTINEEITSIHIDELVEQIYGQRYRRKIDKEEIKEEIELALKSEQYIYAIDENGDIKENLGALARGQRQYQNEMNEKANEEWHEYLGRVQNIVEDLENKNLKLNDENIMSQFNVIEQHKNSLLISLLSKKVLHSLTDYEIKVENIVEGLEQKKIRVTSGNIISGFSEEELKEDNPMRMLAINRYLKNRER